ncbi:MAG: hypothetical protein ACRD3T_20425 [Terriglobia bacterium]
MTLSSLTSRRVLTGVVLTVIGLVQIGCGGGGGGFAPGPAQSTPQTVSVNLSPNTATLNAGATQQFSATVTGTSNTAVTWTVNGVAGGSSAMGTVSAAGLYTAPGSAPSGSITVTATSVADSSSSASSSVKVRSSTAVSVRPSQATLATGGTQQLAVTVTGTTNTAVSWSVNGVAGGNSSVGTVSSAGLYTAPSAVPSPNPVTVRATSIADPSSAASSSVKVTSSTSVSVSPSQATLTTGGTQQFAATVTGTTNTAVSWSVNGVAGGNSSAGTVSSTGLYTAPSAIPSPNPVTLTATSTASPGVSASASVTVAASGGSLSSLKPIVTMQNTQSLVLTVNGAGFTSGSQVQFNGASKPTTFVNSNQVTAPLSSDDLAQAGTFAVAVGTGSTVTPALSFYVVPALNSHEVTVTAGSTASMVNVAAQSMTNTGPEILQAGLNSTADAGGASVAQGSTATLLLVGQKIAPGTYYEVSGNAGDVTATQPLASSFITTTGGQPAVQLSVTVTPTAATGPRNILVTDPEGEVSVFVGGLLITPAQ